MHFIQLRKFKEENPGVTRKLEQWMWFLINKNGAKVENVMEITGLKKEEVEKLF